MKIDQQRWPSYVGADAGLVIGDDHGLKLHLVTEGGNIRKGLGMLFQKSLEWSAIK